MRDLELGRLGCHDALQEVDLHLQSMLAQHEDAEVNHGHIEERGPGVRLCPVTWSSALASSS